MVRGAYHATRADLLRRLGRSQKSRAAYDRAIDLAGNTAETAYLTRRRDQLGSARGSRSKPRASGAEGGGGVSYRRVHQASMITSWAMPVSMV